ncbi:hypothetical protein J6590_106674 [Homalodisca vitripennis]|nr:hypothetical protein J6590_106674 [Homalodisca vitripennis]
MVRVTKNRPLNRVRVRGGEVSLLVKEEVTYQWWYRSNREAVWQQSLNVISVYLEREIGFQIKDVLKANIYNNLESNVSHEYLLLLTLSCTITQHRMGVSSLECTSCSGLDTSTRLPELQIDGCSKGTILIPNDGKHSTTSCRKTTRSASEGWIQTLIIGLAQNVV